MCSLLCACAMSTSLSSHTDVGCDLRLRTDMSDHNMSNMCSNTKHEGK